MLPPAAVCASHPRDTQAEVVFSQGYNDTKTVTAVAECPCEDEHTLWWLKITGYTPTTSTLVERKTQHPALSKQYSYAVRQTSGAPHTDSRATSAVGVRRADAPVLLVCCLAATPKPVPSSGGVIIPQSAGEWA